MQNTLKRLVLIWKKLFVRSSRREVVTSQPANHPKAVSIPQKRELPAVKQVHSPATPKPNPVYGPQSYCITESIRKGMQEKVKAAAEAGKIQMPTDDQWKMIFATRPAELVVAGAGSGKSTTLILRVILLLNYLHVQPGEITVISFTRAACRELRTKLIETSSVWDSISIDEALAEQMIRTFHSTLVRMAGFAFPNDEFFEHLKTPKHAPNRVSSPGSELLEDETEDELPSFTKLSPEQQALVNEAYRAAFEENSEFRFLVLEMQSIEFCRNHVDKSKVDKEYHRNITGLAARRDQHLISIVNARYQEKLGWPPQLLDRPEKAFTAEGFDFYANAWTPTGLPVFLGGMPREGRLFSEDEQISDADGSNAFPVNGCLKVKFNLLGRYFAQRHVYVDSRKAWSQLVERLKSCDNALTPGNLIPFFDIKLDGEMREVNVASALFDQGVFVGTMGIDPAMLAGDWHKFAQGELEHHFCRALPIFWRRFRRLLADRKLITYDHAFQRLANDKELIASLPDNAFYALTHVLIDEFQDISPQIAEWIISCQRRIPMLQPQDRWAGLMAIGDDWQSIYGWRGSAPDYMIDFKKYFPLHEVHKDAQPLRMVDNFRSVEPILRDAEVLVQKVARKINKSSRARRNTELGDHGVKIIGCDEFSEEVLRKIARWIVVQYEYTKTLPTCDKTRIIVMCRANSIRLKLKSVLRGILCNRKDISDIAFLTYHRAKGLQGEIAVMIGDCAYSQNHRFRNKVYAASKHFAADHSYDRAQQDESLRLAYVGITRGRRRTFWFVEEAKGAALDLQLAGRPVEFFNEFEKQLDTAKTRTVRTAPH